MDNGLENDIEKYIIVSINRREVRKIPIKDVIKREENVKSIVMREIHMGPEIRDAKAFSVYINGKDVLPKDAESIAIEDVRTIEIFDQPYIDQKK